MYKKSMGLNSYAKRNYKITAQNSGASHTAATLVSLKTLLTSFVVAIIV